MRSSFLFYPVMQYFFITVFILVYLYCFHFSNHHLLLFYFSFFSMKFFCFQIGEPVHEERDAPSLTAPSPHPPMFDKSPHSLDKSYPAFDATPSFDHRNTKSTNGSCGVGEHLFDRESWNDMSSILREINETQRSTNDQSGICESLTRPRHKITEVIF